MSTFKSSDKEATLLQYHQFCKSTENQEQDIVHKLLGKQFQVHHQYLVFGTIKLMNNMHQMMFVKVIVKCYGPIWRFMPEDKSFIYKTEAQHLRA